MSVDRTFVVPGCGGSASGSVEWMEFLPFGSMTPKDPSKDSSATGPSLPAAMCSSTSCVRGSNPCVAHTSPMDSMRPVK